MRGLVVLMLVAFGLPLLAGSVAAQEGDNLVACIEEVKQIKEKEGKKWYENNKTSCLGEGAVGQFSVLELPEYSKKEVLNDMELEFFAFFDVPIAGPEVRGGQMDYQETKQLPDPGRGWRAAKRVEYLPVGDKSQLWLETRDIDISIASNRQDLSSVWASDLIYGELMVITGDCSFLVGGRAAPGVDWSLNHRFDSKINAIVNSNHDHGEKVLKERLQEYAQNIVDRIAPVCGGKEVTAGDGGLKKEEAIKAEASGKIDPVRAIYDWISDNMLDVDVERIEREQKEYELYGRTPQMTDEIIKNAQEAWRKSTEGVKFFDEKSFPKEWRVKLESQIQPGAEIISGDSYTAIIRPGGGSVLYYPASFGVYVIENTYNLEGGLVEVKTSEAPIDIETINAFIKSKGTHYRVVFDVEKQSTIVEVYEGEVEIMIKGGKKILLPTGGRTVVVISRRLSWWKAGLIVIAAVLVLSGVALAVVRGKKAGKKKKRV